MRDTPLHLGVLIWLTWVIVVITLGPWMAEEGGGVTWIPALAPAQILGNLLLMAPAAAVLVAGAPRAEPTGRTVLRIGMFAATLSGTVEAVQMLRPGRYTEPFDVLTNTAGAIVVVVLLSGSRSGLRHRRWLVPAIAAATFASLLILLLGSGFMAVRLSKMDFWDPEFSVVAGSEPTGERLFTGEVSDVSLCGGSARTIECIAPGADFGAKDRLGDLVWLSQHLELRATVVSDSGTQDGPARILTFSRNTVQRNVTLGLVGSDLVMRLRTSLSGPNGSRMEFWLRDAVPPGEVIAIAASVKPGLVHISTTSSERTVSGDYPVGLLTGWRLINVGVVEPGRLAWAAAAAALLLFVPVGLSFGWLWEGKRAVAILGAAMSSGLFLAVLQGLMHASVQPLHLAFAVMAALVGVLLGVLDRRHIRTAIH